MIEKIILSLEEGNSTIKTYLYIQVFRPLKEIIDSYSSEIYNYVIKFKFGLNSGNGKNWSYFSRSNILFLYFLR